MPAQYGHTVIVHITCTLKDGRVLDSTHGREPLCITIGDGHIIIPEVEQALIGMKPGESRTVRVPSEKTQNLYSDESRSMTGHDFFFDLHLLNILSLDQSAAFRKINDGIAFENQGNIHEAMACLREAIKLAPELPAYYVLGSLLQRQGLIDEAIECYENILTIMPHHADTHNALGSAYQEKGDIDKAIASYGKAIQYDNNSFMAHNNLGIVLRLQGNLDEAIANYQKAILIKPDFAAAMNNLGTAWRDKGDLDEAVLWYREAIQLKPDFADAHWNLSFALLLGGHFDEGWEEYEWLWKLKKAAHKLPQPVWNGEDIQGKSILLYAEQGFGDVIQLVRYVSMVADRGAEIILGCQKELKRVLRSISGVHSVVAFGEALPQLDFQCPLPSLPRIFKTTLNNIPAIVPYLRAEVETIEKWRDKISCNGSRLNIGLIWAGSPGHLNDRNRSCPPDLFLPIARINGLRFFSLQKEIPEKWSGEALGELNLIDYTGDIEDFSDTAGIIMNLDLVISVDTAVAHLAGALGKPVWTLLPFAPDWRWLLGREDSPWYPTMRLFRQPSPGDWNTVIVKVHDELKRIITEKTS
jgi:tetratricopeptide (TPR) repeat protein